jgi:hypothetical protein
LLRGPDILTLFGNPAWTLAKNRLDTGGEAFNVRGKDQDVPGLELRVIVEQAQQGFSKHLDLASGTVAEVYLKGFVVGLQGHGSETIRPRIHPLQDVSLEVVEQVLWIPPSGQALE